MYQVISSVFVGSIWNANFYITVVLLLFGLLHFSVICRIGGMSSQWKILLDSLLINSVPTGFCFHKIFNHKTIIIILVKDLVKGLFLMLNTPVKQETREFLSPKKLPLKHWEWYVYLYLWGITEPNREFYYLWWWSGAVKLKFTLGIPL